MVKYLKSFESFRIQKNEVVNEELLGGVINFFKNMWNKALDEIKKLGKNPSDDQLQEWIDKNPLNPSDDSYLLKGVMDEFSKKTDVNQQACLDLVKNILDPQIGSLGKQGMQTLYDGLLKTFGKDLPTVDIVRFYMETIRNRAIKDYKYAGGPDLKIGTDAKVDDKKVIVDMKDQTHLPEFKKVLLGAGEDTKKMKQVSIDWVSKNLVPRLDKYLSEIKDEQVDAYIKTLGKELPEGGEEGGGIILDWGDVEIEVAELSEEEKAKNPGYYKIMKSGSKKIVLKDGEIVLAKISGEAKKGVEVKLTDILRNGNPDASLKDGYTTGKLERIVNGGKEVESYPFSEEKAEGQEDLVKKLGDMKTKKPEDIKKVGTFVDFISDEANKDKVAEIDKIIGGEEK